MMSSSPVASGLPLESKTWSSAEGVRCSLFETVGGSCRTAYTSCLSAYLRNTSHECDNRNLKITYYKRSRNNVGSREELEDMSQRNPDSRVSRVSIIWQDLNLKCLNIQLNNV
ncbi:hypothetical protein L596_017024 [Steinernema carpocapsae]|uniref:Uncharacterized protein n=1 Tax=Steinernema carpocapsae TaxID=34508 RepID=A0A4U5N169_STECR|nr:hypothetical protein L596_017024 [Steinernema carpocapsae]